MSSSASEIQNAMLRNFHNLWFLVQYDRSRGNCVKTVIRSCDFASDYPVIDAHLAPNLYFVIRQNGVQYVALLLFCSESEIDVSVESLLLTYASTALFNSPINLSVAVDDPQLQEKLYYLVAYHRGPTPDFIEREVNFQIFNHKEVRLERDQQNLEVTKVFVQDQQQTYEASLIKVDFTLGDLMKYLIHIRKMRPSQFGFDVSPGIFQSICPPTGSQCSECILFGRLMQNEAVRRVGLMNFQNFSKALLERKK